MALSAMIAGCGNSTDSPPDGVSMTLQQWRTDPAQHTLQIAVRNESQTPVHFADVQLVTGSFEVLPPHRVGSTLRRTPRTDFEISYGRARCPKDRLPEVAPAEVIAHLRVGDESLHEVRFPLQHPNPMLVKLLEQECTAFLVRQSADFAFGGDWKRAGDELHGSLVVTRTGGQKPVTLQEIGDTTHYRVHPRKPGRPVAVLAPDRAELRIPIKLYPSRCDPHAFADAKQAFLFPVWVAVGDGDAQYLRFTPPKAMQSELLTFARDACGL